MFVVLGESFAEFVVGVIGSVEGGVATTGDSSLSSVVNAAAAATTVVVVVAAEAATAVSGSWLLFVVDDDRKLGTNSMAFTFNVENLARNSDDS